MSSTINGSCLKKSGEDCSCHHCQISRRLPKERASSHKQWPPRPRLSSLRSEKGPTFCWWNVQIHSIQRHCCISTKVMLVIKCTCNFSSTDIFFNKEQIYLCRHRVNANLMFDFSLMSDQAFVAWKPSAWFPYNLQEMTSLVYFIYPPKFIQIKWVHLIQFRISTNGHYFFVQRIADKRTRWLALFGWWFYNSEANRREIFTRLIKRVNNKVWKISHESIQFHPMK